MRMIVLVALILAGICVGIAGIAITVFLSGDSLSSMMDQTKLMGGSIGRTRWLLLINHVTMFLLPAVAWSLIYYKRKWFSGLGFQPNIQWLYVLAGILFLMVSYPIVAKSYEINQSFSLPEWMNRMEGQTSEFLKTLLVMNHPLDLLVNLLVIAIIPGLGEELIFRGIIQKELQSYFKSPWMAVFVASVIFSAMHFQFAGFIPRFLLGMILGLLFYWTNNLWTSIVVHAFNNAFQVILSYFNPNMLEEDFEKSVPVSWYVLLISLLLTVLLGWWFQQKRNPDTFTASDPVLLTAEEEHPDQNPIL